MFESKNIKIDFWPKNSKTCFQKYVFLKDALFHVLINHVFGLKSVKNDRIRSNKKLNTFKKV
jgi:hypothetical protein